MMSLTAEEVALIQSTPLFGGLSPESLAKITNNASPRDYPKKSLLFQEGDKADHFYIVLHGLVKLFRCSYDGNEAVIHVFGRGENFAECAMFIGAVFPVSAEVVSPARLLRLEGAVIRQVIREEPEIAFAMLASASRHLKQLVDQIEQMKVHTGPERVAEFLLGLTKKRSGPDLISLPFEKILIANQLGMKPESFSRALAKLRSIGVNSVDNHIAIDDTGKLLEFARSRELGGQCAPCKTV
jgi:CRP-like cAMP-binding protein